MEADTKQLSQQLTQFGFQPPQIRDALEFLSNPSPLSTSLSQNSSQLEACIEFLVLNVPECDLPKRFMPSNNTSRSAISSMHSGTEDIRFRWIVDRMHAAGWPVHSVKEVTSVIPETLQSIPMLVATLDKLLIGEDWKAVKDVVDVPGYNLDTDEMEAMGTRHDEEEPDHIIMPLFSAPVELHILASSEGETKHVHPQRPSLYLLSKEIPAYVRLHMLSRLLLALSDPSTFIEPGEGFCIAAMRNLEATWAEIEDKGRPDVLTVMQHLTPTRTAPQMPAAQSLQGDAGPDQHRKRQPRRPQKDDRSDAQVKLDFDAMRRDNKVRVCPVQDGIGCALSIDYSSKSC